MRSTTAVQQYLNVENNFGHECSQRHEQLDVSHEPLDGLLEKLLLHAHRVVPHLRLGDLPMTMTLETTPVRIQTQQGATQNQLRYSSSTTNIHPHRPRYMIDGVAAIYQTSTCHHHTVQGRQHQPVSTPPQA